MERISNKRITSAMQIYLIACFLFLVRYIVFYLGELGNPIRSIYIKGSWLFTILTVILYCIFKCKLSKSLLGIGLYSIGLLCCNLLAGGELRVTLSQIYPMIALIMCFEILCKFNLALLQKTMAWIMLGLINLNFLCMLINPLMFGEYRQLLAPRNQLGIGLLIACYVIYRYTGNDEKNILFIEAFVLSILSIILAGSMNNLLAYFVIIFWLLSKKVKSVVDKTDLLQIFIGYIIFALSIVVLKVQNLFAPIIEGVFNRTVSLSGRTDIWDILIPQFKNHPLIGHGMFLDTGYFDLQYEMLNGGIYQQFVSGHNTFLHIAYESGLVMMCLGLVLVYYLAKGNKCDTSKLNNFMKIAIVTLFLIMFMEAVTIEPLIMLCIFNQIYDGEII